MPLKVNPTGVSHAKSLIRAGRIDYDSPWSFNADDGNEILGDGDWGEYKKWFLAIDPDANEETKDHYAFPYGKNGKVYRRGVIAAKVRASQYNYTEISDVADELLSMIDEKGEKALNLSYMSRAFTWQPSTLNEEDRSVEVVIATETPTDVYDPFEGKIVKETLKVRGCVLPPTRQLPLLDSHKRFEGTTSVIGSVRGIHVEEDKLVGKAYFASDPLSQAVFTKVKEGHLTDISVGYIVLDEEKDQEGVRTVTAWKAFEVSVCPIGADENAKIREAIIKEGQMEKVQKEREEVKTNEALEIVRVCKLAGKIELAEGYLERGLTVEQVKSELLEEIAKERQATRITVVADERDKFKEEAIQGLLARMGYKDAKPNDFSGLTLKELARECLRMAGQKDKGQPLELVQRAISSSDLPYLLENVANKFLFDGFEKADTTWQEWCGTGGVSDFKDSNIIQLSALSVLQEIPEAGEYVLANISDAKETVRAKTYGLIFPITRQTIINDDLNALSTIPQKLGEAAARTINYAVYSYLASNPTMRDGVALFHSTHGNLGTAGAINETTIGEAIKLMKKQKDIGNNQPLNIRPRFVIAPVAIEATAEIFFNSQMFAVDNKGATRANIYAGNVFTRVYDPVLDESSASAWYMAADKGKTINVYFLNNVQTPYLEREDEFDRDIIKWKIRLDFGVKAIDWRGLVKNAGA